MKIPKSLKLPRKLKKEVKKGITRNVRNTPDGVSCSMYETVTYSGSNTKAFRRLLKYLLRLQKIQFKRLDDLTIKLDLLEEQLCSHNGINSDTVESVNNFKSEFDEFKKINAMSNLIGMYDRYQPVNPVTIVNPENIL